MSDDGANRRNYTRVIAQFPVEVCADTECVRGTVRDLSMNGIFVECVCGISSGSTVTIDLELTGSEPAEHIRCHGKIIRADERGLAINFDRIEGEESYAHLRNVIMYNAGDPERAVNEIAENSWVRQGIQLPDKD